MIGETTLINPSLVDASIGKYKVESLLGEGGMGTVYKAYDPDLEWPVAIKVIHKNLLAASVGHEVQKRFQQEARITARLHQHPNIVQIHHYGVSNDGAPYIVMELMEGEDLDCIFASGHAFSLQQALDIVIQILEGLVYMHEQAQPVLHRDLKPSNIFVLKDKGQGLRIKITDFGIAHRESDDTRLTRMGQFMGTIKYMAPEQRDGQEADIRCDLYAVGKIFQELLSHTLKTSALDRLLEKALSESPQKRFQTAREFQQALIDFKKGSRLWPQVALGLITVLFCVAGALILWPQKPEPPMDKPSLPEPADRIIQLHWPDEKKLHDLLTVARAHLKANRLVMPLGSNAYDALQMALAIAPDDQEALALLKQLSQVYYDNLLILERRGEIKKAQALAEQGEQLFPGYEPIQQINKKMKAYVE